MSVKHITMDERIFDPREYHTIITVTRRITTEMYALLKRHKVGVISLVCGNNYMYDQEEFLRGMKDGSTAYMGESRNIDEQWLIPCYYHALDYVEMIRKKPAFLVPHLWSPEIVREYTPRAIHKPEASLFYNIEKRKSKKINIVMLEPNLNLFKTAWLPIVASEKLYMDHPELVEFVFVFNFPEHDHAYRMTDTLSLGPKLRKFQRKSVAEIMHFFNNESDCTPIFVSHQVLNGLNYLYYELLYYGFPLVHNSPMMDGCGYFYPETNIKACVDQILYAYKHHDKSVETYKEKAKEYLKRVDPLDPSVQKTFDQMITASIVKNATSPVLPVCFIVDEAIYLHLELICKSLLKRVTIPTHFCILTNDAKNLSPISALMDTICKKECYTVKVISEHHMKMLHSLYVEEARKDITGFGYAQLLLPEYFTEYKKVLVMEPDQIVQSDLAPLWHDVWSKDIKLGAVDYNLGDTTLSTLSKVYPGKPVKAYNTGVVVVDTAHWNTNKYTQLCLDVVEVQRTQNGTYYNFYAEGAINIALQPHIVELSSIYNTCNLGWIEGIAKDVLDKGVILHWNGTRKPWKSDGLYKSYYKV